MAKKVNPIKRIRDQKRYIRPQQFISFEEWEDITNKAIIAKNFLKEENPAYMTMKQSLSDAENMILENRVREIKEVHVISETLQKIFTTPKKIQDDEIVGQIKFIRTFLAEMQMWIDVKKDVEFQESQGVISVQRSKE